MTEHIIIYTTFETDKQATDIGRALVEQGLAACVNILPNMRSIYKWEGKTQDAAEVVMLIKAKKDNYQQVEAEIKKLHSYQNPCVIAWDITHGSKEYLDWLGS